MITPYIVECANPGLLLWIGTAIIILFLWF